MDVLSVGGKNYVKASVIARDLGYTSDYVGQLCRTHKVKARLVGRSWYVDKESIQQHKQTRYRSSQAKSKEELKEHIRVQREPVFSHSPAPYMAYSSVRMAPVRISYDTDDTELFPTVQKVIAQEDTPVEEKESDHTPEATALEDTISKQEEVEVLEEDRPRNIDISPVKITIVREEAPIKKSATQVASVKREFFAKPVKSTPTPFWSRGFVTLCFTTLCICMLVGLFGLEARVEANSAMTRTSYNFETDRLQASVAESIADLENSFYLFEFSTSLFDF